MYFITKRIIVILVILFMMTYSIVARSINGDSLGIGVISGSYNVGSRVPWIKRNVGAVVTQAYTNPELGRLIINYLSRGFSAVDSLERALMRDRGRKYRQLAVITPSGDKAYYTGRKVPKPYGEALSKNCICIGNMLESKNVVEEMLRAFMEHEDNIVTAILSALEAGHEAGGDLRGDYSGAVLIVGNSPLLKKIGGGIKVLIDADSEPVKTLKLMVTKKLKIEVL